MHLHCTVVMPAYDEAGCIAPLIAGWTAECTRLFGDAFRIVAIDDGSFDGTGEILDGLRQRNPYLVVQHQPNQGHGASVMRGYRMALEMDTDYVFQTDSDDQFEPGDFLKLWEHRHESQFILGWRQHRHDPLHRLLISRAATWLIGLLFSVRIEDANVPYRLMGAAFLREILPLLPPQPFAPNLCLSVIAARKGQKPLNIPVRHKARKTGTSAIVRWPLVRACLLSLRQLVALRLSPAMRK